jgi:iron uptake system component EfeO
MKGTSMPRSSRLDLLARLGAPLIGLVVVLAACGGAASSAAAPTPVPSGVVAVEAKEYTFTPSTITVPAGPITFSVKNAGSEEHEFEVFKGDQVVDEIEGLVPGLTVTGG